MLHRAGTYLSARREPLLKGALRLLLVCALVVVVLQLLSPATYRVSAGYATFQLQPTLPGHGGHLIMPLGPAGVLEMKTHRTPLDLTLDFRFDDRVPSLAEARAIVGDRPGLERDAVTAFDDFLISRIPWVLALGALIGILVANGGPRWVRRTTLHAVAGTVVVALVAAALVGLTLATLDRTPTVSYRGLATYAPRVLETVRGITHDSRVRLANVQDSVRGLETVATQLKAAEVVPPDGEDVTRILVASDIHDNVAGLLLASSLAQNRANPVSAVILAGDLTSHGTDAEARLVVSQLARGSLPVVLVGGNHEDAPAMSRFAAAGYHVLDGQEAVVDGVAVYGVGDPLDLTPVTTPDPSRLAQASTQLLSAWRGLAKPPQLLVVHNERQAADTIAWARARDERLTVVYGHDHVAAVRRDGTVELVDPGTSGASGYDELGRDPNVPYTFQILDFSRDAQPRLLSVTTMSYTGLDGPSTAQYTPVPQ